MSSKTHIILTKQRFETPGKNMPLHKNPRPILSLIYVLNINYTYPYKIIIKNNIYTIKKWI